jgi:hypothetical protein
MGGRGEGRKEGEGIDKGNGVNVIVVGKRRATIGWDSTCVKAYGADEGDRDDDEGK